MTGEVDAIGGALITFSMFGGTALIIWTSMTAKVARIKAEAEVRRQTAAPQTDSSVAAELKALRQQVAEMAGTSHQFDISFDEALNRLEGRINRLETKSAVSTTAAAETTQIQRNGLSQ